MLLASNRSGKSSVGKIILRQRGLHSKAERPSMLPEALPHVRLKRGTSVGGGSLWLTVLAGLQHSVSMFPWTPCFHPWLRWTDRSHIPTKEQWRNAIVLFT